VNIFVYLFQPTCTKLQESASTKKAKESICTHTCQPTLPFFWLLIVVFVAGGIKNNKKGKKNLSSYRENQEK